MPIGPAYNEREKRFALTVINTIAPFAIDICANHARDFALDMVKHKKQEHKNRKAVGRDKIDAAAKALNDAIATEEHYKDLRGYFRDSTTMVESYIKTVNSTGDHVSIIWGFKTTTTHTPTEAAGFMHKQIKEISRTEAKWGRFLEGYQSLRDPSGALVTVFKIPEIKSKLTRVNATVEFKFLKVDSAKKIDVMYVKSNKEEVKADGDIQM